MGWHPKAGDSVVLTVEPNFAFGANQSRVSIKDIFRPGVAVDRVFTFIEQKAVGDRASPVGHSGQATTSPAFGWPHFPGYDGGWSACRELDRTH